MERYNGWANYETWNVGLWFMDDMVSVASEDGKAVDYQWCKKFVENYLDSKYNDDSKRNKYDDNSITQGFIGDVIGLFMSSVDWREIASHVNDDAELTDEDEDEESDEE
jgi:hypothetical protein